MFAFVPAVVACEPRPGLLGLVALLLVLVGETLREARLATPCLSADPASEAFLWRCRLPTPTPCSLALAAFAAPFALALAFALELVESNPFLVKAGGECCDFEINFLIQEEASFRASSVGRFFIAFLSILSSIYFLLHGLFEHEWETNFI